MHNNDSENNAMHTENPVASTPQPHSDQQDTTADPHPVDEHTGPPALQDPDPTGALETELAEVREKLLRTLAEAENARKRAEKQIHETRIYAVEALAYDLLPVTDDLDRALAAASADQHQALVDGVGMVRRALLTALERHGVTPIEADVGTVFDPSVHQAVSQIPSTEPKGHIASTFTPGWKIGDRSLRAAMVAVSSGDSQDAPTDPASTPPPLSKPGDIIDTSI